MDVRKYISLCGVEKGNITKMEEDNMEDMNEYEKVQIAIERYASLQRIKKYGQEELAYQERIARAELQMLGISVEDLEIKEKAEQNDFSRRK